ncbi:FtsX-like permease family protein [Rhodanobacter sp. 7MK24]|uniref:ABC transporter permease n=1 Tax=Rhodanobacter sp. 7MK24 TaxID=2775922 RepID=UPI00177EC683|nr:FtsX-like permease family protein [Rhodanobacter sp. 7MK24]MBD8880587.1 FtsX-like permease family protein [Rhodanobacter sp. 7MK24]
MEIRPILTSLRKHRIPAALIVLEIALACAVLCNAVFMIGQRVADIHWPNAIDEQGISVVTVNGADPKLAVSDIPRNLVALRGIAGATAVAAATSMPLDHNGALSDFTATPNGKTTVNTSIYFLGSGGEQALGLHLLEGRFFNAEEYADSGSKDFNSTGHVVLITQSDAQRLWPGQSALGKTLYTNDTGWTVIGVVADVLAQDPRFSGPGGRYSSVFFPLHPDGVMGDYVLRSAPQDRARVVREAAQLLGKLESGAVVDGTTYADMRTDYFADTSSMVWMLVLVCVVMLAVTAFGIVGLTSFWVGQRRQQIGIRRAVGASRGHIMQYFQTENFLLSAAGVVLGTALADGINLYLMRYYEITRMPWYYLPVSAVALWAIGQLAVLGPALRAAAVPPVVATRSA